MRVGGLSARLSTGMIMHMAGYDIYIKVAEEAVRRAGALLKDNLDTRPEAFYKGAVDLVTRMDRESQELLVGSISAAFPTHAILAEEGYCEAGRSDYRWIIDPLDGTTNYSHTLPLFTISVALEFEGRIVGGLVYDPMRDEMFMAKTGEGAYLNGRKIRVSGVDRLDRGLLSTGFPYDIRTNPCNNLDHWASFLVRAQAVRRCGSAAMDLCYVACGRFDGFWEMKLRSWDVAAASLMVVEAGGRVTDLSGGPFKPDGLETLATNGLIHDEMIQVLSMGLRPGMEGHK